MKRLGLLLLIATLAGCLHGTDIRRVDSLESGNRVSGAEHSAIVAARDIARALRDELGIPGLAVTVSRDRSRLWSEGFGFADLELQVLATPQQRFRLASVSKLVTAAIAARLVDQGRLDLDAPVSSFLPDYPAAGAAITARQILGQLSGIRHYQPQDETSGWDSRHFASVRESLVIFRDDPLLSAPGTEEHYSTYAFTLLAAILEVAGGATFPELVEREVAKPLGLATLTADRTEAVVEGRVAFYDRDDEAPTTLDAVRTALFLDPSYKWAGGGLVASSEDLTRFGEALLSPGFLSERMWRETFTRQKTSAGTPIDVGLTWRLGVDDAGRTIQYHSGSQQGARAFLLLYPDERLVVSVLSNLGGVPSDIRARALAIVAPFLLAPPPPEPRELPISFLPLPFQSGASNAAPA